MTAVTPTTEATLKKPLKDMSVAERRAYDRARKSAQRKRDKAAKQQLKTESIQEYWKEARATQKPAALQKWFERQSEVLDIVFFAEDVMSGRVTCNDDDIERNLTIQDVQVDLESIATDGLCATEAAIGLPEWWTSEVKTATVSKLNEPTQVWLRFGIVTALPTSTAHQWERFMQVRGTPVHFYLSREDRERNEARTKESDALIKALANLSAKGILGGES